MVATGCGMEIVSSAFSVVDSSYSPCSVFMESDHDVTKYKKVIQ